MQRSRLQDYLSLNKLHYGFYYPGTHGQKKNNKTKQKTQNKTEKTNKQAALRKPVVHLGPSCPPCRVDYTPQGTKGDIAGQEGKALL